MLTADRHIPIKPFGVEYQGRYAKIAAFPIGIDPEKFANALETKVVKDRIAVLEQKYKDVKLIIGVDRLDYTKGLPQKLRALEVFLRQHPKWVGKVVLVQVAVPSRQAVDEYQRLRSVVNELVGRISGNFGSIEPTPIKLMHQTISFEELVALYAVSDLCLVSSLRDGMNLVSYEYVASQRKRQGVLILSEFTGAAHTLKGPLIVNPWNTQELAGAIHEALTMSQRKREANFKKLEEYVFKYTSAWWGESFVKELTKTRDAVERKRKRIASESSNDSDPPSHRVLNE